MLIPNFSFHFHSIKIASCILMALTFLWSPLGLCSLALSRALRLPLSWIHWYFAHICIRVSVWSELQGETKILKLKNLRPQDYANYSCVASVRNVCGIPDRSVIFRLTNKTGSDRDTGNILIVASERSHAAWGAFPPPPHTSSPLPWYTTPGNGNRFSVGLNWVKFLFSVCKTRFTDLLPASIFEVQAFKWHRLWCQNEP